MDSKNCLISLLDYFLLSGFVYGVSECSDEEHSQQKPPRLSSAGTGAGRPGYRLVRTGMLIVYSYNKFLGISCPIIYTVFSKCVFPD